MTVTYDSSLNKVSFASSRYWVAYQHRKILTSKTIQREHRSHWLDKTEVYEEKIPHSMDDGPAVLMGDGSLIWYCDGKKHRDGAQPAELRSDGTKIWFKHDKLHRTDGPAIIMPDGTFFWYIDGVKLTDRVNDWIKREKIALTKHGMFVSAEDQLYFTMMGW